MLRPKLLLLHGALGSREQFKRLIPLLSSSFEIHSFDFDGHGKNDSSSAFSIERFSENALHYLDEHGIETADIFGFSMGGYVALNLAFTNPDRIQRIITLGTKFDWTPESAQREVGQLDANKIEAKVPQFADHLKSVHGANRWRSVLDRTGHLMTELGNSPILVEDVLSRIKHTVLVCRGEKDRMVSEDESVQVAGNLKNGVFRSIPDVVHPIEQNDQELISPIIKAQFTVD